MIALWIEMIKMYQCLGIIKVVDVMEEDRWWGQRLINNSPWCPLSTQTMKRIWAHGVKKIYRDPSTLFKIPILSMSATHPDLYYLYACVHVPVWLSVTLAVQRPLGGGRTLCLNFRPVLFNGPAQIELRSHAALDMCSQIPASPRDSGEPRESTWELMSEN